MNKNLGWVQALRGIAALLVVICHARVPLRGTVYEAFGEHWLTPGAMGVDLFFMISGFIMVYTTTDSDGSPAYVARFLIKRFARIWPVYVVAAIFGVILQQYNPPPMAAVEAVSPLAVLKSLMFLPVDGSRPPFFGIPYAVGWTLNFEVYFYIVFAVSMLLGRFRWYALAGWFVLTLIALPFYQSGTVSLDVQRGYGFASAYLLEIVNPIVWEFAVGAAIGLLYVSPRWSLPRGRATRVLLIGSVAFTLWYNYSWRGNFNGLGQWGAPLAILLLIIALTSKTVDFRVHRLLIWLGGVSYSLYLFHPIAAYIALQVMSATGNLRHIKTLWFAIAIVLFAVLMAALSGKLLENGLSRCVQRNLLRQLDRRSAATA